MKRLLKAIFTSRLTTINFPPAPDKCDYHHLSSAEWFDVKSKLHREGDVKLYVTMLEYTALAKIKYGSRFIDSYAIDFRPSKPSFLGFLMVIIDKPYEKKSPYYGVCEDCGEKFYLGKVIRTSKYY